MKQNIDKIDRITILLKQAIKLLSENNQKKWAEDLTYLMQYYLEGDSKQEALSMIKKLYGGAGTLNDVVLHKDRKPLIEENNQFEKVRHELYEECMKKMT